MRFYCKHYKKFVCVYYIRQKVPKVYLVSFATGEVLDLISAPLSCAKDFRFYIDNKTFSWAIDWLIEYHIAIKIKSKKLIKLKLMEEKVYES